MIIDTNIDIANAPAEFIPIVEDGLIVSIGEWIPYCSDRAHNFSRVIVAAADLPCAWLRRVSGN